MYHTSPLIHHGYFFIGFFSIVHTTRLTQRWDVAQSLNPEAANACIISLICAWLYLCPTNSILIQNGILLHVIPTFVFIYRITPNRFIFNRHRPPFYQPNQCWSLRCFHGKKFSRNRIFLLSSTSPFCSIQKRWRFLPSFFLLSLIQQHFTLSFS